MLLRAGHEQVVMERPVCRRTFLLLICVQLASQLLAIGCCKPLLLARSLAGSPSLYRVRPLLFHVSQDRGLTKGAALAARSFKVQPPCLPRRLRRVDFGRRWTTVA
ncbi:unnamed protein product [Polarella glacialis]|uniref:Uncharacterized protein n=1 Tax=Polarella glacialis TaxID=89957 RepID=A0A813K743_POLGL|nr:unnamed protein product [Polarella glacialis]CAE8694254.1 unnamed protein product [Polarella glacialis]